MRLSANTLACLLAANHVDDEARFLRRHTDITRFRGRQELCSLRHSYLAAFSVAFAA